MMLFGLWWFTTTAVAAECPSEPALMQLLHWESKGDLLVPVLHQPTVEKLGKISGPVGVVSMIGPYRSGKSHLLNQLLPDQGLRDIRPFAVGHTTRYLLLPFL
jgi:hypothetical protein